MSMRSVNDEGSLSARRRVLALALTAFTLLASAWSWPVARAVDDVSLPADFISPGLPEELNGPGGGAYGANLEQAAVFAWREFIALNWPAASERRDTPGSASFPAAADARVWETFRGRVEVFPGTGRPFAEGAANDYGYDAPPRYVYDPERVGRRAGLAAGEAQPCAETTPAGRIPWNNLDEPSHQDVRSALSPPGPFPGQQVLTESKVNRNEYVYVASRGWYGAVSLREARRRTGDYVRSKLEAPPPPKAIDDPNDTQYVSFPLGTIELKAAWRRLGPHDEPREYYVNRVRYYGRKDAKPCYVDSGSRDSDDRWGLLALHIMHKTASAPYFIWATFEQVNSLVLDKLGKDGRPVPVETAAGDLTPAGRKIEAPYSPNIQVVPATPEKRQRFVAESLAPAITPGAQLYYHQAANEDTPEVKYVGVNRRLNPIPETIVRVNRAAQAAIRKTSPDSPFQYYRLVSVQWLPLDKKPGAYYEGPQDPAVYYAASVIIEAPQANQRFSGQLSHAASKTTDFLYPDTAYLNPGRQPGFPVFLNVFHNGKGYLAGGCMGCHGFRQAYGTDFSFLLDRQRVREPEVRAE